MRLSFQIAQRISLALIVLSSNVNAQFNEQEQFSVDSLKEIYHDQAKHDTLKADALLELANYYYYFNTDTTFIICKTAEELSEKHDYLVGMTDSYGWMGYLYAYRGDTEKAQEYNFKSLDVSKKTGDQESVATLLNNIASNYFQQGDVEQALHYHFEHYNLRKEMGNDLEMARALNSIALVYRYQGYIDKALIINEFSLEIRRKEGVKEDIATSLNNIGVIKNQLGLHEEALLYLEESLDLRVEINYQSGIANSYNNMGISYSGMNQSEKAIEYYTKSLIIREELNEVPGMAGVHIDLGIEYLAIGEKGLAKIHGEKGYELAAIVGLPRYLRNSSLLMSKIYEEENRGMEALHMYKLFIDMRDSLNSEETQKITAQKEAKFNYVQKKALDDLETERVLAKKHEEQERQEIIAYASIIGLLLVIGFLIIIFNRLKITRRQKELIEHQKDHIEEVHKEITDSIAYAKRIQSAILPSSTTIKESLSNSFVLYKPKDVVAGDFYWLEKKDGLVLFAAADCTGHGVPGAMVSVVCNNALNRSVREYGLSEPGKILDKVREIVVDEFEKSDEDVKDGMDIALCSLNGNKLCYAGANNPLWIIRNGEIIEIKADKQPIGKFENSTAFKTHVISLVKGDKVYVFSDGLVDQFGGEKGKKFKPRALRELLLSIESEDFNRHPDLIFNAIEEWRGELEQVDDICMFGVVYSA